MKRKHFILPLLFLPVLLGAQDNMFVIYSIKGNVSVIENKVETKAKIGTMITGDATIKVANGSFATLLCNETRMFSLSKSGNYTTASMKDSCKAGKSSVSTNYMKYIWTELTKSKGTPEKNRKYYMSNLGAVSRGDINNVWVDPRLDTVNYVSGTIPLSWISYAGSEEFDFRMYDETKEKLTFSKTVKKKHIDVSDLLKSIHPGKIYYWAASVKDEDENKDKKYFHYMTKEAFNSFYNSVKKQEAAESEAEASFRIGFIMEENHYLVEAYNHYLKATQLAPDNSLYRFTFMSFKKDYEIK